MTDRYDSPGKEKARALVTKVFASEGGTVLDFYGGGRSARQFVEAGLIVTSAEIARSLHERLRWDAAIHGYEPFFGRASRIKRHFDCTFTDFTGGPSPKTRRELRVLASRTDKWLAVTLSPDRQLDEFVTGPSSAATVPAWIIEATGMRLEYIGRYIRNEYKQWMWIALLTPRESRRGRQTMIDPLTMVREIQTRKYWATDRFRRQFPTLVPHRNHTSTAREAESQHARYMANRDAIKAQELKRYYANREKRLEQQRAWREANPEKVKAIQKRWRQAHPDYFKNRKEYRRAWYLAHREEQIEKARLYREAHRKAA